LLKKGSKDFTMTNKFAETVLLAEDDFDVRKVLKKILEKFNYEVIEAVDGEDAVNVFQENKHRIQLLILDVIMPKKDGVQAYDEIKSLRPEIKAIMMSGNNVEDSYEKRILDEPMSFMYKPIYLDSLLAKVRQILNIEFA
jgi:two-component system cell cycle sensor histidine kinase/response regulator CckA